VSDFDPNTVSPLSKFSNVVKGMGANNQILLYVKPEDAEAASKIVREVAENERNLQGTLKFDSSVS
jgi:ADP-heptose:LPS heptosyltransferase